MSSDVSRDPRPMAHLWCRACGHRMHTSAHCKTHFKRRQTHRSFGIHCACCDRTYSWEELVPHLNVRNAHQRPAVVENPPSPRTASPDRSCSVESSPRLRPYDMPTAQRRRAGPLRAPHDSSLTQARQVPEAALGAPPASPMSLLPGSRQDRRYHTGFTASSSSSPSQYLHRPRLDVPPNSTLSYQSPDLQGGDQSRVSSSGSTGRVPVSSQPLYIPDANWSLTSEALQPPLPLDDYINSVYTMSAPSTVSSPLVARSARRRSVTSFFLWFHWTRSSVEPTFVHSGRQLVSVLGSAAAATAVGRLHQLCIYHVCSFDSVISVRHAEHRGSDSWIHHIRIDVGCR